MFYCQSCRLFYTDLINNPFNTTPKALSAPQLKKFLIAMKIADLFYAMRINFINSECIRHIVWLAQGLNLVPLILQIYHWFMQFNTHRFPSPRHCQNIFLPIYIYLYIHMTNLPHNSRMARDDHLENIFLKILSLFGLSFFGIIEINLKKHILHFFTQESSLQNINIIK